MKEMWWKSLERQAVPMNYQLAKKISHLPMKSMVFIGVHFRNYIILFFISGNP
jgi:hypothetical protein